MKIWSSWSLQHQKSVLLERVYHVLLPDENNIVDIKKKINDSIYLADKMNQLRHLNFFKDVAGLKAHMKKTSSFIKT